MFHSVRCAFPCFLFFDAVPVAYRVPCCRAVKAFGTPSTDVLVADVSNDGPSVSHNRLRVFWRLGGSSTDFIAISRIVIRRMTVPRLHGRRCFARKLQTCSPHRTEE